MVSEILARTIVILGYEFIILQYIGNVSPYLNERYNLDAYGSLLNGISQRLLEDLNG